MTEMHIRRSHFTYHTGIIAFLSMAWLSSQTLTAQSAMNNDTVYRVKIITNDEELGATLLACNATRDFVKMLPLDLTLNDYASTEKVSDLPERLNVDDAPEGCAATAGDITYYAPWGSLAIFYRDFKYSTGLVHLGRIESSLNALTRSNELTVRIELAN